MIPTLAWLDCADVCVYFLACLWPLTRDLDLNGYMWRYIFISDFQSALQCKILIVHDNEFLLSNSMLMDLLSARNCVWRVLDLLSFITPQHFQAFPLSSFWSLAVCKNRRKGLGAFFVWMMSVSTLPNRKMSLHEDFSCWFYPSASVSNIPKTKKCNTACSVN